MSSFIHSLPKVTLILPIRNEVKYIQGCLESIIKQDYPHHLIEVIISDGMSTDGSCEAITSISIGEITLHWIDNPGKIVPTGMNLAIQLAKGEILIRVDGHCEIAPNYVNNCVNHLVNEDVDGVGGPIQTIGENRSSETIAIAMSSFFGVGGSAFRTIKGKTMLVDSVPFPAYTREIIEKVGLFDEELVRNQDDEYNYRIRAAGGKLLLAADVHSRYYSRGSLRLLWKQYFQYGFWKVRVLQKHPRQMSLRQFVPPFFVCACLVSVLFTMLLHWGWVVLVLVGGSYLLANLVASILTSTIKGWQHLPLLPLTFAIMHLSYGLGFLIGLFTFWNRWNDKKGRVPELIK